MGNDIDVRIGGDSSEAQQAIAAASQALKDGVSQMAGPLGQLTEGFSQFKGVLMGFSAILAGGAMFKEALQSVTSFDTQVSQLSKKLGITSEAAGQLSIGLKLIGSSADVYTGAASKLDRQLRTNEQSLKNMGISTRDANGNLKNQEDLMTSALDAMMHYKEGTDRNMAAQAMFGRGADEMTQLMKLNNDVKAEATRIQIAYNMHVGDEGVTQTKAYKMAMNEVSIAMDAIMIAVGKDVLPMFVALGDWFKGEGVDAVSGLINIIGQLGDVFKLVGAIVSDFWTFIKETFNGIKTTIEDCLVKSGGVKSLNVFTSTIRVVEVGLIGFQNGCKLVFEGIGDYFRIFEENCKTLAKIAMAALKGDWVGVKAAWKQGMAANEKIIKDSMNRIIKDSQRAGKAIQDALFPPAPAGKDPASQDNALKQSGGNKTFVEPKEKKGKADQDKRLQEWKNELDQMKEAEGSYFKDSKEMEEQFWTEKLAQVQGDGEKEKAIRRAIEHELFNIHKAQALQSRSLDEEQITAQKDLSTSLIEQKKDELKEKLDLGQISNQQELAGERDLSAQQFQINLDALNKKMTLYQDDLVAYAKLKEEKLTLERTYAKEVQKINNEILVEQKKACDQMLAPITNAIATSVNGIVQGTTTAQKALHNIFQSIMAEFIQMCAQQVIKWAAKELNMTSLTKSGSVLRSILEKTGLIETEATAEATNTATAISTQTSADAQVTATAPVVAAKAAGSVAGYPYVGPILAAAAFAAMLAMVLGSRGHAVGSWDVPGDMITKIHKGEMIVPSQFAQNVREGGGLGGGGDTHLHVHAIDAKSVQQLFMNNSGAISDALKRQVRNFSPQRV